MIVSTDYQKRKKIPTDFVDDGCDCDCDCDVDYGYGYVEDSGGKTAEFEVEVEEGVYEKMYVSGQGYLKGIIYCAC